MKLHFYLIIIIIVLILVDFIFLINFFKDPFNKSNLKTNTSGPAILKEVRQLQRYETASFIVEKIIEAGKYGNTFQDLLYGDRILMVANGEVIAGFDLSTLPDDSIRVSGDSVSIDMPKPQILIINLNNDQTRVYDRKTGLLTKGDRNLESLARQVAEDKIKEAACQGNILSQASENAKKQFTILFNRIGFSNVEVKIPQGSCN